MAQKVGRDFQSVFKRILRDYAETLFFALALALVLRFFVVSAYRVSNPSMIPNLRVGDFIVGFKLPYGFTLPFSEKRIGQAQPYRNHILIFKCPKNRDQRCIKRVVGLPGDRIQVVKKKLLVNNRIAKYEPRRDIDVDEVARDLINVPKNKIILTETVMGHSRNVFMTGAGLEERYGPFIVPPGHIFVLSDQRDDDEDSRQWGVVPITDIEARAWFVWFSIDWTSTLQDRGAVPEVRWRRIFQSVR